MQAISSKEPNKFVAQWKELHSRHTSLRQPCEKWSLERVQMMMDFEKIWQNWRNAINDCNHFIEGCADSCVTENSVLHEKVQIAENKHNEVKAQLSQIMSTIQNLSTELDQYKSRFEDVKMILKETNEITADVSFSHDDKSPIVSHETSFESSHSTTSFNNQDNAENTKNLALSKSDSSVYRTAEQSRSGNETDSSVEVEENTVILLEVKGDVLSKESNIREITERTSSSNGLSINSTTAMTEQLNGDKRNLCFESLNSLVSDAKQETTLQESEPITCEEAKLRKKFANLSIENLREQLQKKGCQVGPMDAGNRKFYEMKLARMSISSRDCKPINPSTKKLSVPLQQLISYDESGNEDPKNMGEEQEKQLQLQFLQLRTAENAACFCYLLIDPSMIPDPRTCNLEEFILAIFYVGKGKNTRPLQHLLDANNARRARAASKSCALTPKLKRILDLWYREVGVISLPFLHNIHESESLIREGSMIEAIGIENLTNERKTNLKRHGCTWAKKQIVEFGAMLLKKAHVIFKNERCRPILKEEIDTRN
ncbi:ankyrin repeat and LEM domain-containing protein 1 like protein [Ditylenchus destructor]|uniref:Ankyrin repeat and LEM domain-containing protein 1 like protein n=1 Tax=Ditylenchus destructor TaxID=166010 RepID=A0AAD4N356_9BILA|nr:ankyrin repeat and LEM domain-containing protein 1 like protein [Ditylenchus destructor]